MLSPVECINMALILMHNRVPNHKIIYVKSLREGQDHILQFTGQQMLFIKKNIKVKKHDIQSIITR